MDSRSKVLALITLGLFSVNGWCGNVTASKITEIYCGYYSGKNMCSIYFDKEIDGAPTCHVNNRKRMQIKTDDDTGKAILSLALTAHATQKPVDIGGKGTCDVHSDTEDMNVFHMKQ